MTLVEAVEIVTLNGTPRPELALAVHSTAAAKEPPVLYVSVDDAA